MYAPLKLPHPPEFCRLPTAQQLTIAMAFWPSHHSAQALVNCEMLSCGFLLEHMQGLEQKRFNEELLHLLMCSSL